MPIAELDSLEAVAACELCGSTDAAIHIRTRDHLYGTSGDWTFLRCHNCGLIYLSPRPTIARIGAYYPDLDYHAFKKSGGIKSQLIAWLRQREAKGLLRGLSTHPTVLEIGCGTGDLLAELARHGAVVTGIEPNPAAAQTARDQRSLDVRTGVLDDQADFLPSASFDRVLMRYALEHVHHPLTTLRQIAGLLKPDGRAMFWVPNARSWDAHLAGTYWRGLDAPRHLYIFTPATMRRLIEAAGLRLLAVTYSPVPNDWVGSAESWLRDQKRDRRLISLSHLINMENPIALAAALPFSLSAAALRRAGRMCVVAGR
ncbi:MAG: class I SAM-dependent methyltransferase [Anaerolineae bacterium]|nr:class I SAM-dependent methyltransferase [Anaerolineae bacterium]